MDVEDRSGWRWDNKRRRSVGSSYEALTANGEAFKGSEFSSGFVINNKLLTGRMVTRQEAGFQGDAVSRKIQSVLRWQSQVHT
ncbi:hypothetical protein GQ457_09G028640 [Hibiscus cannabinus]